MALLAQRLFGHLVWDEVSRPDLHVGMRVRAPREFASILEDLNPVPSPGELR